MSKVKINYRGMFEEIQLITLVMITIISLEMIPKGVLGIISGFFVILFVLMIIFARNNLGWFEQCQK